MISELATRSEDYVHIVDRYPGLSVEEAYKKHQEVYFTIYRENNKKEIRARNCVAWAIRSGKLKKQSCEICGKKKTDAHHDDYSRPLEVRWLCRSHHKLEHHNTAKK